MEKEPKLVETNTGKEADEDELFYETIEAPKYVDLTAPDSYRPGDDRYWFCLRVGCDQRHEEEMDAEAIYKNFVLRVMAARSPNVRLRKALCRKDSSSDLKCPKTVPAKPSKPRVSRLALISSISKKLVDPKIKAKPPSKPVMTPNPKKVKQSSMAAKCLTTPRNKKQLSNLDASGSARNLKITSNAVPSSRVVAKALLFHSPKKAEKAKISMELKTPVKELCAAMKKLDIASAKKQVLGYNRPSPSDAKRKQFRGREVKSRVYDGLCSQNHKVVEEEAKSAKCLKKTMNKEKELQHVAGGPAPLQRVENDSTVKEIEDKPKKYTVEECSNANQGSANEGPLENAEVSISPSDEDQIDESSTVETRENGSSTSLNSQERSSREDNGLELNDPTQHSCETNAKGGEEQRNELSLDKDLNHVIKNNQNKKYSLTSDDKENDEVIESDYKENASSTDENNRELEVHNSSLENKPLSRHKAQKDNRKISRAMSKLPKKSSATVVTVPQVLKQRKPKPTNPKPFRLRTDERRILKEATMEKKLHLTPLKETPSNNLGRHAAEKNQSPLPIAETFLGRNECSNGTYEASEDGANGPQRDQPVGRKLSMAALRHTVSSQQKLVAAKSDKEAKKRGSNLKRAKSHVPPKWLAKPRDTSVSTKKRVSIATVAVAHGELGAIRETSTTSPWIASKPSLKSKSFRISTREPKFLPTHMPKTCTRRVA